MTNPEHKTTENIYKKIKAEGYALALKDVEKIIDNGEPDRDCSCCVGKVWLKAQIHALQSHPQIKPFRDVDDNHSLQVVEQVTGSIIPANSLRGKEKK